MDDDATLYLAKAQESLHAAESEFANGRYNSCANRCYYACFQAAIAALLREGIRPPNQWDHKYVQSQFAGQLIHRRKRFDSALRGTLYTAFNLRSIADYLPRSVTQADSRRVLADTRVFVSAISERVSQ